MDVKTYSEMLKNRMNEQIESVKKEEADELMMIAKIIQAIRVCLFELKQFIHQYEFKDQGEEIFFFKETKPKFLSQYFYYNKLLSISVKTSLMDVNGKKKYYRRMLKRIHRFQKRNGDFWQYWFSMNIHLDDKYFMRHEVPSYNPNVDDKFSVEYDIKLAQLLAYKELKSYLISSLKNQGIGKSYESKLKWTGSKTALIELIYALQTVGVFNNSTSDVKQIVKCFEELFDIKLGNFYDTFQQIRIRKNGQTNFIDHMREKLIIRIENFDC